MLPMLYWHSEIVNAVFSLLHLFWLCCCSVKLCRNTGRGQDSRGSSRGLVLRGMEKNRFRSSGDQESWWNCMYHEDFACFLIGLIYYDKTPASRWIVEELGRNLPQDDVLCPQSGDTVWHPFLMQSPAGSCRISPRDSFGMGSTTEGKVVTRAGERIPHIMGRFSGSFQIPQQRDFLARWTCCFVHASSTPLSDMNVSLSSSSPERAMLHHPCTLLKSCHESQWTQNQARKDRVHRNGAQNILIFHLAVFHPKC